MEGLRDGSRLVRIEAAHALGEARDKDVKVIAALIERLEEDDKWVRDMAAGALIKLAPESIPLLIDALGDENAMRRLWARRALEKIGPLAVPQLSKALADDNDDRKQAAKAILRVIQTRIPGRG